MPQQSEVWAPATAANASPHGVSNDQTPSTYSSRIEAAARPQTSSGSNGNPNSGNSNNRNVNNGNNGNFNNVIGTHDNSTDPFACMGAWVHESTSSTFIVGAQRDRNGRNDRRGRIDDPFAGVRAWIHESRSSTFIVGAHAARLAARHGRQQGREAGGDSGNDGRARDDGATQAADTSLGGRA